MGPRHNICEPGIETLRCRIDSRMWAVHGYSRLRQPQKCCLLCIIVGNGFQSRKNEGVCSSDMLGKPCSQYCCKKQDVAMLTIADDDARSLFDRIIRYLPGEIVCDKHSRLLARDLEIVNQETDVVP